jgi:hypothetical protein
VENCENDANIGRKPYKKNRKPETNFFTHSETYYVEVLAPDHVICTLAKGAQLENKIFSLGDIISLPSSLYIIFVLK